MEWTLLGKRLYIRSLQDLDILDAPLKKMKRDKNNVSAFFELDTRTSQTPKVVLDANFANLLAKGYFKEPIEIILRKYCAELRTQRGKPKINPSELCTVVQLI